MRQRRSRGTNIKPAFVENPMFAGIFQLLTTQLGERIGCHQTIIQCWFTVGPSSAIVTQHNTNIKSTCHPNCWESVSFIAVTSLLSILF